MTDLAILDQAVREVKCTGPWLVCEVPNGVKSPILAVRPSLLELSYWYTLNGVAAESQTLQAIRETYKILLSIRQPGPTFDTDLTKGTESNPIRGSERYRYIKR